MWVKWKRKRGGNGLCLVVGGSSGEVRAVRNGLMLAACLPPGTRVASRPGLLPMAMFKSVTARVYIDIHDP